MFSCFRKAELIVCNGSLGGQMASLPLLPWLILQSIVLCGMRCLIGQSGSAVLLGPFPAPCAPQPASRAAWEVCLFFKKIPALCKHCCTTTEASTCYHHCFPQKSRPWHPISPYEENYLSWNHDNMHFCVSCDTTVKQIHALCGLDRGLLISSVDDGDFLPFRSQMPWPLVLAIQ